MLGRELLNKPDGFIMVNLNGKEYLIESIQRKSTYANIDDSIMYWNINIKDDNKGGKN